MTAAQPSALNEPPPQRGLTREERGRDVSEALLLFWPMRAYQKKHHPEEYAESQRKK